MPELPKLTAKEAEKILLINGFSLDRQKGSHRIYIKSSYRVVLPHHSGKILHPKIIKELFNIIVLAK
ncbi:type II toxin-antitoxin system HicA family toxin [Campylobacter helveticus]|uniref:Addiction module toxin, HicA family n=1 Tax=Campylobacter helveticus TaxID=28898 RepID=A0AAX2UG93_9BACT|nr:type II toxin-antitoxin system HicA family toxin [Campylobacter helveticus]ARE79789.1 putative toxin-antitoxin system, toxin component, HicA family [Campylobacter helveticus]MCR2039118.1 type II toxin-antitoxin system HicA family toxin [Campylobacter helveticus]MCR2055529.1 type II toxin-antitoxin system HicA family toxin [Campylobacter helveticus]MCR2059578.1 type II toxin-antitoxin system HicA family toxin [Campylobacter helveticus]MCR2062001.1 type II toxin-antitoxin system HicA family t